MGQGGCLRPHCDPSGDRVEALGDEVVLSDGGGSIEPNMCVFHGTFSGHLRCGKHKELVVEAAEVKRCALWSKVSQYCQYFQKLSLG